MESSRQEYCSGLPFPTPGDLADPGIGSESLVFPYHCATWEALLEVFSYGLGVIWGCFIYGHKVTDPSVCLFCKGRSLQVVRVSTLMLTSAYGSEVWGCFFLLLFFLFLRKIIKNWILLTNYSSIYSALLHISASISFSFQNKYCPRSTHTPFPIKKQKEFWKQKWSSLLLHSQHISCYHFQRDWSILSKLTRPSLA